MRGSKYGSSARKLGLRAGVAVAALGAFTANGGAADPDKSVDKISTATPIKHVIVVIAENSSFDHAFGTFRPREGQHIHNLLSKGIVNADGTELFATVQTIAIERARETDGTSITLAQRPDGKPDALVTWFYPGRQTGHEFLYSKQEETELTQDAKQTFVGEHGTMVNSGTSEAGN